MEAPFLDRGAQRLEKRPCTDRALPIVAIVLWELPSFPPARVLSSAVANYPCFYSVAEIPAYRKVKLGIALRPRITRKPQTQSLVT